MLRQWCQSASLITMVSGKPTRGRCRQRAPCISDFGCEGTSTPSVFQTILFFFSIPFFLNWRRQGRIRRVSLWTPLRETDAFFFFFSNSHQVWFFFFFYCIRNAVKEFANRSICNALTLRHIVLCPPFTSGSRLSDDKFFVVAWILGRLRAPVTQSQVSCKH